MIMKYIHECYIFYLNVFVRFVGTINDKMYCLQYNFILKKTHDIFPLTLYKSVNDVDFIETVTYIR